MYSHPFLSIFSHSRRFMSILFPIIILALRTRSGSALVSHWGLKLIQNFTKLLSHAPFRDPCRSPSASASCTSHLFYLITQTWCLAWILLLSLIFHGIVTVKD